MNGKDRIIVCCGSRYFGAAAGCLYREKEKEHFHIIHISENI
jgi:hypothetical protein